MRVIVMGCGRVGSSLADGLSRIGHDIAVIDRDSTAFNRLSPEFDGLQYTFLAQAGHRADFRQRLARLYEEWRGHMAGGIAQDQAAGRHGRPVPVSRRTAKYSTPVGPQRVLKPARPPLPAGAASATVISGVAANAPAATGRAIRCP